jgi:hypothetical protein
MSGYGLHSVGSMFVSYPTGFEDASLLGNAAMSIINMYQYLGVLYFPTMDG